MCRPAFFRRFQIHDQSCNSLPAIVHLAIVMRRALHEEIVMWNKLLVCTVALNLYRLPMRYRPVGQPADSVLDNGNDVGSWVDAG